MKKLVFRKISKDTSFLFISLCLVLGAIVWTLQAVNYLDYITQDGYDFKTYLLYSLYNFPKIVHRLIPFIFFISLYYILINYEKQNELIIYWINGISKVNFANKILFLSIILFLLQIIIGSYISPYFQFKSRMILKNSDANYFSSLIKEGKFIDAMSGLTIFIENRDNFGSYKNIFIDDSTKNNTKITYANTGKIVDLNNQKIFKLFNGSIINKSANKINKFEFDQIDINLSEYSSNTILVPKVQETSTLKLLKCSVFKNYFNYENIFSNCNQSINKEVNQEVFKRLYKPIYIPIIAIICCFLIILPKNNIGYNFQSKLTFLFGFLILLLSETTLRYSATSFNSTIIYLITPWLLFLIIYSVFIIKSKNV